MRYAKVKYNDIANAPGVCVSFFTQGCPHKCFNCFNQETWDFNGGKEFTPEVLDTIIEKLNENNIHRDFCLLGGEPLCDENILLSFLLISTIKEKNKDTKIYVWTGYTLENLLHRNNPKINTLLNDYIDVLIDGPYVDELRNITLPMRGSSNQRILYKGKDF